MIPKPKKKRKKKPESIMKYAKDYCQYCGATGGIIEVHHIQNKGMGGSSNPLVHHPDNLITLCRYHHDCAHRRIKDNHISPEQFVEAKKRNEVVDAW